MCEKNNNLTSKTAGKINFNSGFNDSFLMSEAFKTLRTNLIFCGDDIKTILVTSSTEGEGKSTVSTELAIALSQIKKKTLIIYSDMRKPNQICEKQNVLGLSELLSQTAVLGDALYETQTRYLNVIFSGKLAETPAELLSNDVLGELLDELKNDYDYIIIDSPPLIPVIDAALISVHCDGAILVIASEKTTVQEASIAKERLENGNCRILGAILNQTQDSVNSKYYGKKYGHYSGSYSK